jgi:hypothetical protein
MTECMNGAGLAVVLNVEPLRRCRRAAWCRGMSRVPPVPPRPVRAPQGCCMCKSNLGRSNHHHPPNKASSITNIRIYHYRQEPKPKEKNRNTGNPRKNRQKNNTVAPKK